MPDIATSYSSETERRKLYAYHAFDKAHLVMLAEENIIPRRDATLMLASLREMEAEGVEKVRLERGGGMHSGEQYLTQKLSEDIGGRINLGRSSGDLNKVGDRIKMRDSLLDVMDAVNGCRKALLKTAAEHVTTVMPGYTHGQQAQPTTLGHQLLCWAIVLSRDFARLESAFGRINLSPAGCGIMTGSDFPLNRHRVAELLGFARPSENTLDAVHSPDDLLEAFAVIAILHSNLGRWADDLIFWTANEINMLEISDQFCGTSSIMPHKKNPYALEHIRGAAGGTLGGLMAAFYGEKGQTALAIYPRNYYSKPALWEAFDNVTRDLRWLKGLMAAIKVHKELMEARAGAFWAQATDVASAIVREKGLPWRAAHQIVGILVRLSNEKGIDPRRVTAQLLDEAAVEYMGKPVGLGRETLQKSLDPVEFVRARRLYGGPAPEESRRRIAECLEILEQNEKAVENIRGLLQGAAEALERAMDEIIEEHANH